MSEPYNARDDRGQAAYNASVETKPTGGCRDCYQRGGTYRDPCGRCGAPFAYSVNAARLAWLLRRFGSSEHNQLHPSTAQWDVAAHLDESGVRADA